MKRIEPRYRCVAACVVLIVGVVAPPAQGQLVSPGKLSQPHAELEGISRCTDCHRLRERGIANDLCLACHTDLGTRIAESRGYHATLADRTCAECHKDHFGRDFALIRLDTAAFDHDDVGFALEASHDTLDCRQCHTASLVRAADVRAAKKTPGALDRTFLGLNTDCESCHGDDNPHGREFAGRACDDCHTQGTWNDVPSFDHDSTAYPLTGKHRDVTCDDCHRVADGDVRYTGLRFETCTACHRDPHQERMGPECESCHRTAGWQQIPRDRFERDFDHRTTDYVLEGGHADLACAACHSQAAAQNGIRLHFAADARGAAYPRPRRDACTACHLDRHDRAFASMAHGGACDDCHTQDTWVPSTYDAARHNAGATFVLTGAHVTKPCASCHDGADTGLPLRFRMAHDACAGCHAEDDPHEVQFASRPCDECHSENAWTPTTYDLTKHNAGGTFVLSGGHAAQPCSSCHGGRTTREPLRFRLAHATCVDCHAGDDPHGGQFERRPCDDCHTTDSYRIAAFPHDATRYPLDGRHRDVSCDQCHVQETGEGGRNMRRYRPLGTQCEDCHGGQQ